MSQHLTEDFCTGYILKNIMDLDIIAFAFIASS